MNEEPTICYAMSAIRRFLMERPDSADTLEGIHRWWIRWPGVEEPQRVTRTALERLEYAGELEKIKFGTSVLWRRRR